MNYQKVMSDFNLLGKAIYDKIKSGKKLTSVEQFALIELSRIVAILQTGQDPGATVKNVDVIKACVVDKSIVTHWRKDGYPEEIGNGLVSALGVIKWIRSKWVEDRDEQETVDSPALERKRLADAEMREMDLSIRKGLLMDSDEARRTWNDLLLRMWSRIKMLPDKLTPLVYQKTMAQILKHIQEEIESSGEEIINQLNEMKDNYGKCAECSQRCGDADIPAEQSGDSGGVDTKSNTVSGRRRRGRSKKP